MKLNSLPLSLFVEVLDYLADYEHFKGLDHILHGEYTVLEVRSALRELAREFRRFLEQEKAQGSPLDYRKDPHLTGRVKDLLSALSPTDEKRLLQHFGFLDL